MKACLFVLALATACGGSSKPTSTSPTDGAKIDCVKLTDHILALTVPEDREARRAEGLRTCPAVWHAEHPTDADRANVACLMAAQTQEALAACAGEGSGSGSGSGSP